MFPSINGRTRMTGQQHALPLEDCLAKTRLSKDGRKIAGRDVLSHCLIVARVARSLIARMPKWLANDLFPSGSELIAGTHDIGKASPTFAEKIYRATFDYLPNSKPGLENVDPGLEKRWRGHGGVSMATAQACSVGKYIPEILGQHHGYSPDLGALIASDNVFGGHAWEERRIELIDALKEHLNCDWPKVSCSLQARVLSGLTTVSDWIGSCSLFDDPSQPWQPLIEKAVDLAGFVAPKLKDKLGFHDVFGFEPRDAQLKLIQACTKPGLYILEAPMGLGKTEAALYAFYQMLLNNNATGLYFALPTQLTSNKIHERVNEFLAQILDQDCQHRQALLLHGNAWLKQTEMGEEGQPGGSWFNSGKRGILAPFAVGTIDQALMAVMNVKHGFVRTFGLAGKVVILDEVHSYDSYTGTILDRLVEDLLKINCTVIILSATLTLHRRKSFMKQIAHNNNYPLISALETGGSFNEISVRADKDAEFLIQLCDDDNKAINEALRRAGQGQQVLWIENTVAEAQNIYQKLANKATKVNVACGLLHSRFLKCNRDTIESKWVSIYGKTGSKNRHDQGRILVGTQILEQSLDIDSDFLITRICPTDMLLQRLGRLWRHKTARNTRASREAWILAPKLNDELYDNSKQAFGKTARVYSPYVLYRSLEVWNTVLHCVKLPSEIRKLIDATYEDRIESGAMQRYKMELQHIREKLNSLALVGLSQGGRTLPESKASTRYSDQITVDVLLLQSYSHNPKKTGTLVTFINGQKIYLPRIGKSQNKSDWKKLAALLMQNTVKVPDYLAPVVAPVESISWLTDYMYLGGGEDEESSLRVAIVSNTNIILSLNRSTASITHKLTYDLVLGYRACRTNK